ncbi:cell wall-active antibiotics response protein LiaF [Peribacillus deserti]|uniref:Cell wall-active antibiotics response protein n=1 Tax=Peribacillus deserti TaxID=673318 RepID=A0A2N5M7E5_9BACI|nr:cell wall-active antibiotics response protein LiaF [Peribacillus deserti]PLT30276.1 cell wall-active antibiotics response protein [Peribacillus deserti]
MLNKLKTDHINLLIWVPIFLIFVELLFFHSGLIFSLLFSAGLIYVGRKKFNKTFGVILFWFGMFSLVVTIFNMFAAKFLVLAMLIYLFVIYNQSKRKPKKIRPIVLEKGPVIEETMIKKTPLFQNRFYGTKSTGEHVYEWNDINIQGFIGDTEIDLSYTVLPKGESAIYIRHGVGNIRILVPYDIELSVNHSAFIGSARILDEQEPRIFTQNMIYQTADYDQAAQRVKIFTSLFSGELEVKRV